MAKQSNLELAVDKFLGIGEDSESLASLTTEDSDNGATTDTTTEGEGEADKTQQPADTGHTDAGASDKSSKQPSTEQPTQRQADPQGQQTQQGRLPANNKGDLVDPTTGAVIARAGNERRLFEQNRSLTQQYNTVQQEVARLRGQVETYQRVEQLPKQLNLSHDEVTTAMQFMAAWKADPTKAATNMLAQLRQMGYEVEGLGSAVDTAAIQRLVKDTIAPFVQDREAATREAEIAANVDRELNEARARFPWLDTQQDAIAGVLDADETLTLREAALIVQSWAAQQGYDLQQPLREQHVARMANGNTPQPQQPARPDNARTPAPTASPALAPVRPGAATTHDRRNRDIVLEAMREAGLNIDNLM